MIIKRYRFEFKSIELFDEIKKSIQLIAPIMANDCMTALNFLYNPGKDQSDKNMELFFQLITNGMKIFYSLNSQVKLLLLLLGLARVFRRYS